jgi:putative FmdB family regulatory protein
MCNVMALYEYVCRACDVSFELRRAMGDADNHVSCPNGHADVRRKLSVFASAGTTGAAAPIGFAPSAGGCCGGACGCGH